MSNAASLARLVLAGMLIAVAAFPQVRSGNPSPNIHLFGDIEFDEPMEHAFEYQNEGAEPLLVKNVEMTPPLVVTEMSAKVLPGETGRITVKLSEKGRVRGEFSSPVVVNFKNNDQNELVFWVKGRIVEPIEVVPMQAFFLTAQRGEEKTASVEIVNHESAPLEIINILHSSARFDTNLKTLEPGKRFELSITLLPTAPAGREREYIELVTSSRRNPFVKIQANTNINERVYAFPPELNYETINVMGLKSKQQSSRDLAMELMVYQKGGEDFQISATSDVEWLHLEPHQAHLHDRYGIFVSVIPEKMKDGPVDGSIFISTNDPEFPQLTVPVQAVVQGSW